MRLKSVYRKLEQPFEVLTKWTGYVTAATGLLSWASRFFAWGSTGPFPFLRNNLYGVWLCSVTAVTLTLLIWASRLNRKFAYRFSDNFSGDLRENWDFEGDWRIPETGTLSVTQSDAGGLSKVGATWENYTLTFKASIIKSCLGVIVRGTDLNNYCMLQINPDQIRPHRRVLMPVASGAPSAGFGAIGNKGNLVTFTIAWQIFPATPISPALTGWFEVRIVVRGESVRLYIDDRLRYHQDGFLKIPMGKIGFRNSGEESALVKDVRVVVQS